MSFCKPQCHANAMPVDARGRACSIRLCSVARPHMRGFWFSTLGFFVAFLGWFAMAPLMSVIKKEVGLTKDEVYNSNILAVSATIFARIIMGPLCDRFGPRLPMALVLIVCAVPLGCAALIHDAAGLYAVRTLVGFVGATFVPCQFWTTQMFTGRIVGLANALAGGWGNLGAGVTHGLMIGLLNMFQAVGCTADNAWRFALLVPAVIWIITGGLMIFLSDDCPAGRWKDRFQVQKTPYSVITALRSALAQPFTYLLVMGYACGFGVELYVDNTAAGYFEERYHLDHTAAGLIASLFGLMNIFARALGGWGSDMAARRWFLRGRMVVILVCILGSGVLLCVLSAMSELWAAITVLVIFSIFCQASCGAVYGLVPFVCPQYSGMVSGLVGAGGNLGAMCWGFVHKAFGASNQESTAYLVVGIISIVGACMILCGRLRGAAMLPFLGNNGQALEEEMSRTKCDVKDIEGDNTGTDLGASVYGALSTEATTYEATTELGATVYEAVSADQNDASPTMAKSGNSLSPSPAPEFVVPMAGQFNGSMQEMECEITMAAVPVTPENIHVNF